MRQLSVLFSMITFQQAAFAQTEGQSADTMHNKQVIKSIINQREQARLTGDKSVGRRVLAPTYQSIDEIGTVTAKSSSFDSPMDTAVFRQIREVNAEVQLKIRVDSFHYQFYNHGATAVVQYRLYYNLVFHKEPCEKVFQCNEVLIRGIDSTWQSVSHTETVIPGRPYAAAVDPNLYDAYVGRYQLFSKKFYTIRREGDKLLFGSRQAIELIPEDESTFVENGGNYYRIKFVKDSKGQVTHFRLIEFPGVEYSALKQADN